MPHRKSSKTTTTRKSARSTTRAPRAPARETRRPAPPAEPTAPEPPLVARAPSLPPHELYRHEKRRRAGQPRGDGRDPLEEARREFKAMLEAGVGTPRGGRPRKVKPRSEDDNA
ncbi:MAG: hypothetical protein ABR499_03420 [Gemmatimonadaceae bacterium]